MKAKHTRGPWQIEYGFIKQDRKDGQKIVRIVAPHPDGGWQDIAECLECNANLFCAAPDLLSIAKTLCAIVAANQYVATPAEDEIIYQMEADGTPMEIIIEQARAAIAKAEGGAQ